MMKRVCFFVFILFLIINVYASERGLTTRSIEPENTTVIGKAIPYIPQEDNPTESGSISLSRDWELVDSIFVDSYIPEAGHYGIGYNGVDNTLEIVSDLGNIIPEAQTAIFKAPRWLKAELENVFSQLSESDQLRWADCINEAQHPYIDEVAFSIAQSSVVYLSQDFAYPELFTYNAMLIYDHDLDLNYVEVVDYGDPASDPDYYSTTRYWKMAADGNTYQVEVPKDIYYMYLVHPKNTDEIPAFIDPEIVESNATHQNNLVSPSGGVFWRDYLYNYNDPGYPRLKYFLMDCDIVWNGSGSVGGTVMGALNSWISQTLAFTSNAERPHQPVRIYKKHIGRCGEHADLRSAAARAALVPCTSILTMSTDHTWNEFWDEGWIHWDGAINNPLMYENGWGKHHASVFEIKSNGFLTEVSDVYSEGSATLNVYVLDANNDPVDGARIILGMHNGSNIVADMVGFTGNDGRCTFVVGEDVSYYAQVQSYVGDIPGYMELVEMAEDGEEYDLALYPGGTMPHTQVNEIDVPDDDDMDYKLVVDCSITQQIPHGIITFDDIDDTEFYDYNGPGSINFFMADLIEYYLYADDEAFSGFDPHYDVESVTTEFDLPDPAMGYWYAFFDNKYRVGIPQHLTGSFKLYAYDGAGGTGTISGTVTDEYTGEVLENVAVNAGIYSTLTDGDGNYTLSVFPNTYQVYYQLDGYFPLSLTDVTVTLDTETEVDAEIIEFPTAPANVEAEVTPEGYAYVTWDAAAFLEMAANQGELRELESYNVYVGLQGDEMNVDTWSLSGNELTATEYMDMIFPYLPMGIYRYAVKAVFSGGNQSPAILSNNIYNQMLVDVGITVTTNSGDDVSGANITLSNQEASNSIYEYTAVLDETGYTEFPQILMGTYLVSVDLPDFDLYEEEFLLEEDTDLEIELTETIEMVNDLSVVDFQFSWQAVSADREFLGYNVFIDDELLAGQITATEYLLEGIDNGYHTAGVSAVFTTGSSAVTEIGFEDGMSISTDLEAYYSFNGDVNDESGNENHGTIIGEISYPDGDLAGAAAEFTGMDDYIEIPTIFTEAPAAFSVVWWLNPASNFNWNQQIRATLGWNGFNFHTTNEGYFYVGTNTGTRFTPDQLYYRTILPQDWQQFCYTYENGYSAFFINGERIAHKTGTTAPVAWNGMWIGCDNTNTIDGMIDEVRVWNRGLGSAELQHLYTETVPYWGNIEGYVLSEEDSEPVEGAVISAGIFETVTDAEGYYLLEVAATTYTVTCQLEGYDPVAQDSVSVEQDATTSLDFIYPFTGSEEDEIVPQGITSLGNYPNPFNPTTTITFTVNTENGKKTELIIYNIKGQMVKDLSSIVILSGLSSRNGVKAGVEGYLNKYEVTWDGTDKDGTPVTSGIYYYQLKVGSFKEARKMLLLK